MDVRTRCRRALLLLAAAVPAMPVLGGEAGPLALPREVPAREPGAWRIERTGTYAGGAVTHEVQKVWNLCLDAAADRRLHELEMRELQVEAAREGRRCETPRTTFSGNTLSWTMSCSAAQGGGGTGFRQATTFDGDGGTRSEARRLDHGRPLDDAPTTILMTRTGACPADAAAGDMMLMHWRIDGEETLKGRRRTRLQDEIARLRAEVEARLAR